jgi:hypothetical protein
MSMSANILAYPPTDYFPNINFNNDFYSVPNNGQGITLNYANTHYLFSTGNASSTAITTFFSGSIILVLVLVLHQAVLGVML